MKVALFCKPTSETGGRHDLVEFCRGEVDADDAQLNNWMTIDGTFFKIETSTGLLWVRFDAVDAFAVLQ